MTETIKSETAGSNPIDNIPSSRTAEAHISSGWVHYARHDYPPAEAEFRQALLLDERLVDALYGLGLTQRAQSRNTEARAALQKALTLADDARAVIEPARRSILRQMTQTQLWILASSENQET